MYTLLDRTAILLLIIAIFFSCVSAFYILQNPAWMRYTAGRMSSFVSYLLPKGK